MLTGVPVYSGAAVSVIDGVLVHGTSGADADDEETSGAIDDELCDVLFQAYGEGVGGDQIDVEEAL